MWLCLVVKRMYNNVNENSDALKPVNHFSRNNSKPSSPNHWFLAHDDCRSAMPPCFYPLSPHALLRILYRQRRFNFLWVPISLDTYCDMFLPFTRKTCPITGILSLKLFGQFRSPAAQSRCSPYLLLHRPFYTPLQRKTFKKHRKVASGQVLLQNFV
jgi:hypothetical protein